MTLEFYISRVLLKTLRRRRQSKMRPCAADQPAEPPPKQSLDMCFAEESTKTFRSEDRPKTRRLPARLSQAVEARIAQVIGPLSEARRTCLSPAFQRARRASFNLKDDRIRRRQENKAKKAEADWKEQQRRHKQAFSLFDYDKDGRVSRRDLQRTLEQRVNRRVNLEEVLVNLDEVFGKSRKGGKCRAKVEKI